MKIATTFTKALTKALKTAERIQCMVNNNTKAVYVCASYFLVKLSLTEYDSFVRPATMRDAGNYCIRDGEIAANQEPGDLEKVLFDAAFKSAHSLEAAPMTFDLPPHGRLKSQKLRGFYSESGDFVAALNSDYAAIVSGCEVRGINPISPLVFYSAEEPIAMICPVKILDKPNISNAVRAYFRGVLENSTAKELEKTRAALEESENLCHRLLAAQEARDKGDIETIERISGLESALASKDKEIAALKESLSANAVESTETVTEPEAVQDSTSEPETATEDATGERGDVSDAVKERMESGTHSIKFFWNGIKVNGGKLIKCRYVIDCRNDGAEFVAIYSRGHRGDLPRDMFNVVNNSDSYQDYFEDDHTDVFQGHPLYRFARAAAILAEFRQYRNSNKNFSSRVQELEVEYRTLPQLPKQQPTTANVEAVHALNLAAETARIEAEHEKEIAEREKVLNEQNDGRRYIESVAAEYPIVDGAPVVTIPFSENPAFYSWVLEGKELKLSVAAAEIVLKHYDEERTRKNAEEGHGGYDKTDFRVDYTDASGESSTYEGRYDLGDNDGGLIAHIRAFAEIKRRPGPFHNEEAANEISALADILESNTAAASVVSVQVAPWLEEAARKRQEAKRQEVNDILDTVEMLTDQQLAAAVFAAPKDTPDVARFFLQELAKRDEKKALSVFRSWQNGEGLEALDGI